MGSPAQINRSDLESELFLLAVRVRFTLRLWLDSPKPRRTTRRTPTPSASWRIGRLRFPTTKKSNALDFLVCLPDTGCGSVRIYQQKSLEYTYGILNFCGEGEIRTHDALSDIAVFKTAALNHSATSPSSEFISRFEITVKLRI